MYILESISLLSFLIYIYLGIIVYLKQPENALNRTFFIYSLFTVYMCFTDFQMRVSTDFGSANFWFRMGVLWHMALSALMHFVFVFTRLAPRRRFYLVCTPLYLVGFFFALLDYFGNLVINGPQPSRWGWSYGSIQQTLVGNLYVIWSSALIAFGILLCLRHYLKASDPREKQKAKFVLIGTSAPMLAGIFEITFSRAGIEIPDLILLSFAIGSGFFAFAIWKYELFVLSPATTIKEIIQTMSDVLFLVSPDRKIRVANQAALELFGYDRDEIINQPVEMLFDQDDFQQMLDGPIPEELARKGVVSDAEITVRTKAGHKISISLAGTQIRDKNNQYQGVACIGRDITRRKREERELRRYQEQLKEIVAERTSELEKTYAQLQRVQKLEFMGTIAGSVAHDLNNILSGIVSYPELILMDLPQDHPLRNPIMTIQRTGEKAATIVTDLLTLARREVMVKSVINLNHIVQEYLQSPERWKMQSYHPDAEIVTRLDPDLPNVIGSPVHLSKALMNLVNNGVEAMPKGGMLIISTGNRQLPEGRSGYERIEPGNYAVLSVSDPGLGIAAADLERIFEPFYTKKNMGKSGTGLGMAVVWGTVKDHGGYVDVRSVEGQGTTFSLYFPASLLSRKDSCAAIPMQSYMGRGETVLVVDDVSEQREIACRILEKLGYTPTAADSGEAAIAYLEKGQVDILLLDMIMNPGIDGLETYQRILAIRPNQKAIIASGFSESQRVREALALGVGAFVRKPYSIEIIGMALRAELDRVGTVLKN